MGTGAGAKRRTVIAAHYSPGRDLSSHLALDMNDMTSR